MNVEGRWGRSHVLATGDGTSGNALTWVRGEVGVAWDSDSPGAIRVATKPIGRPWQRSTITSDAKGGALRSLDINPAGDLVVTWENWKAGKGYSLGLALRRAGGNWSFPRLVYTDLQNFAPGSVLARPPGALVAYGDDFTQQLVARRAYPTASR